SWPAPSPLGVVSTRPTDLTHRTQAKRNRYCSISGLHAADPAPPWVCSIAGSSPGATCGRCSGSGAAPARPVSLPCPNGRRGFERGPGKGGQHRARTKRLTHTKRAPNSWVGAHSDLRRMRDLKPRGDYSPTALASPWIKVLLVSVGAPSCHFIWSGGVRCVMACCPASP